MHPQTPIIFLTQSNFPEIKHGEMLNSQFAGISV